MYLKSIIYRCLLNLPQACLPHQHQLTFTIPWANSADFLVSQKTALTCHADCLQKKQFAWNNKASYLEK